MHDNEVPLLREWLEIMTSRFGIEGKVHNAKQGKWHTATVNSVVLADFFGEEFGVNCVVKTVPRYLMDAPTNVLSKFLEGFYAGDGRHVGKSADVRIANRKLCTQLYEMSLRCGYSVALSLQSKGCRGESHQLTFMDGALSFDQLSRATQYVDFVDGNRYCRFDLRKLSHNEPVYDITVEEDHSFTVAGVIVHNCSGSYVDDSVDEFYSVRRETALLTKYGFGTSGYFGDVRPRGSAIRRGGKASGIVPVIKSFVQDSRDVSQGGVRRRIVTGKHT